MRKILAIIVLAVFSQTSCSSQIGTANAIEITLTKRLVDSLIDQEDYGNDQIRRIANNLYQINQFNSIKRILNQTDTIRVYKENNNYLAYYREKKIGVNQKIIEEENLINIWGSKAHTINYLFTETFNVNGISQRIILAVSRLDSEESSIKISNYMNDVISGPYQELYLNGDPIVLGNYILIDSIYQDTIITYDYETYDEQIEVIKREQVGVKCGEWIHYSKEGQVNVDKHKINCK